MKKKELSEAYLLVMISKVTELYERYQCIISQHYVSA